ncbi:lipoprotein [Spiroplasma sp. DGKH1]|uniref:lipoprotein n=1 Tax=Spiroplasma sp. DGKH1 TaxID=3050074 RepID=UPI0034C5D4F7
MKKLLASLGALVITGTTVSNVISCNEIIRISTIDLNKLDEPKVHFAENLQLYLAGLPALDAKNFGYLNAAIMQKLIESISIFNPGDIAASLKINIYNAQTKNLLTTTSPASDWPTAEDGIIVEVVANPDKPADIKVVGAFKTTAIVWKPTIAELDISQIINWNDLINISVIWNYIKIRLTNPAFKDIPDSELTIGDERAIIMLAIKDPWKYTNIAFNDSTLFDKIELKIYQDKDNQPDFNNSYDDNTKIASLPAIENQNEWFVFSQKTSDDFTPSITKFVNYQIQYNKTSSNKKITFIKNFYDLE